MKRLTITLAMTCAALSLTACSGTTASSPGPAAATSGAAASTAKAVSAEALCDYLRGRVPTLKGIGSEVGAMANLTMNLYSWYEKQGAIPDGVQMDEQTQKQCPDVGKEVLKLAGIDSFASL